MLKALFELIYQKQYFNLKLKLTIDRYTLKRMLISALD